MFLILGPLTHFGYRNLCTAKNVRKKLALNGTFQDILDHLLVIKRERKRQHSEKKKDSKITVIIDRKKKEMGKIAPPPLV